MSASPEPLFSGAVPAQEHFRLHVYAAVYRVIYHLLRTSDSGAEPLRAVFDHYPFLASYYDEMVTVMPADITWEDGLAWWSGAINDLETGCLETLPLRALVEEGDVPAYSRTAFMIAGLPEEDARFGALFADVQAPLPYRRICLEMAGRMAMAGHPGLDPWQACKPLLAGQFVEVENPKASRAEWVLRVPGLLWNAARGEAAAPGEGYTWHEASAFPTLDQLILPDEFQARVAQLPALLQAGQTDAIILRGQPGSDGLTVLGAVARALGRRLVTAEGAPTPPGPALGPLCTMSGAIPALRYEHMPGETTEVPALPGYRGPLFILSGLEGGFSGPVVHKAITLTLPLLTHRERLRYWQQALQDHAGDHLPEIAARFHLPGAYIRQVASIAVAHAALAGRQPVTGDDVRKACRALNRQQLDTLAEALEAKGTWDSLVVHDAARDKLAELEGRCRHRETLLEHLAPAFGTVNRGVRALFSGPSGTGKTLAARILGAALGMDLYRLDLAAVINKYIGETEKNLHRVLAAAEALDVILLIDEGDTLLGNRTDVKSANDRYANLETNYLLQRLEHYNGVVVVTTNLGANIDRAFQRRMDVVVDFLPPQAEERFRIWQLHLPTAHAIDTAYVQRVAVRCTLTGGQIRNAALLATLLALEDHGGPVGRRHLDEAVRSEYRKAGATFPLEEKPFDTPPRRGVEAFLSGLR